MMYLAFSLYLPSVEIIKLYNSMKINRLIYIPLFFALVSCGSTTSSTTNNNVITDQASQKSDPSENAVLWQQTAAEYDALCYQAFNAARHYLEKLSLEKLDGNEVVVLDLDETVLDNSPYNARLILEGSNYSPESWMEWSNLADAQLVPGAKEFLLDITQYGVEVFFISNRNNEELENTIKNLAKFDLHYESNQFLLKDADNSSEKTNRRNGLIDSKKIVMLIGDNLADFNTVLEESESIVDRKENASVYRNDFGNKFIILPNVMYGNWQKALKSKRNEPLQFDVKGNLQFLRAY